MAILQIFNITRICTTNSVSIDRSIKQTTSNEYCIVYFQIMIILLLFSLGIIIIKLGCYCFYWCCGQANRDKFMMYNQQQRQEEMVNNYV